MILKLTKSNFDWIKSEFNNDTILIGTESIIRVRRTILKHINERHECTIIESRAGVTVDTYVKETPEEIYKMIKDGK